MNEDPTAEDAAPASPADSLRLIQAQQAASARSLSPDPRLMYWPWGLTWLIGFGLLFLRGGPNQRVYVDVPGWMPLAVLYLLMTVALILTAVGGMRASRHVSGESTIQGRWYGFSWFGGFAGVAVVANHFSDKLPGPEVDLLWAALSMGVVGLLYMAGAAIWRAHDMFLLGAWLTVCNIVGVLAGPGWHSLVIAVAGGGGMLVMGLISWLRGCPPKAERRP